ncbi:MAG: phosphate/phosphite/phosphonate ABC transporter substrate-binding protein [Symbiobacteriaceae bacterium]|nr:phosphate/phosphite/phosphonate ABC transporter substrate-binding protein [Symbiobacteriaceae bacterium]
MYSLKRLSGFALALLLLVACNTAPALEPTNRPSAPDQPAWKAEVKEIIICYLPNESTNLVVEARGLLQKDLGDYLGIPVKELSVSDYNAVVEAMRTGKADIAGFGPVTYVQAAERAGAEAMCVTATHSDMNNTGYTSQFIVRADSDIQTLEDLRGRSFAFVDPSSTSGNYVPTLELMNKFGLSSDDLHTNGAFFESVMYSGGHVNGLRAILAGDIDAVPIASNTLKNELRAGNTTEADFRIIHESPRIPDSPVSIRGNLPTELKKLILDFYLNYDNPEYFELSGGYKPEDEARFILTIDSDYDYVRDLMQKVMP